MDLIHFIFACFGKSPTPFIRTIRFLFASKYSHVEANIRFIAKSEYSLQNIRFEANIRKTSSKFHIQVDIRLQIFAKSEYPLANMRILANNSPRT